MMKLDYLKYPKMEVLAKQKEYHSESEAIEQYEMDVEWRGKDNIMLLQTVSLKVSVSVTKREQ